MSVVFGLLRRGRLSSGCLCRFRCRRFLPPPPKKPKTPHNTTTKNNKKQAWRDSGDTAAKKGERIWIAEMYGYCFGAASAGVWHHWGPEFMLYPGYTPGCEFVVFFSVVGCCLFVVFVVLLSCSQSPSNTHPRAPTQKHNQTNSHPLHHPLRPHLPPRRLAV